MGQISLEERVTFLEKELISLAQDNNQTLGILKRTVTLLEKHGGLIQRITAILEKMAELTRGGTP